MINDIINNINFFMKKCIKKFKNKINKLQFGKPSVRILDSIYINYYNVKTYIRKISNIVVKNNSILKITVFDLSILNKVKKAIIESNLDLSPYIIGNSICINFPVLTTEKKNKIIKIIKFESESAKINIRNIRRDGNEKIKKLLKKKIINIDEEYKLINKIQIITNKNIQKVNLLLHNKINIIK
ncbi:ribosome-recycling factor [Buchnera aphidicola]|uniref:ribosome-recycling factor n=1 Tax=Buchnera aphidicola TaxID=9 RepID=UPI0031B810E4